MNFQKQTFKTNSLLFDLTYKMKNREEVLSRERIVTKGYTYRYTLRHRCKLKGLHNRGEDS